MLLPHFGTVTSGVRRSALYQYVDRKDDRPILRQCIICDSHVQKCMCNPCMIRSGYGNIQFGLELLLASGLGTRVCCHVCCGGIVMEPIGILNLISLFFTFSLINYNLSFIKLKNKLTINILQLILSLAGWEWDAYTLLSVSPILSAYTFLPLSECFTFGMTCTISI